MESSILSKVFEDLRSSQGLSDEQLSSAVMDAGNGKSTTIIDGSTVVFFTDFIIRPNVQPTKATESHQTQAKGPVGGSAPVFEDNEGVTLLNHFGLSDKPQVLSNSDSTEATQIAPSTVSSQESQTTNIIKPGSVIELSDFLGGNNGNLGGNLGEAIKDIVQLVAVGANKMAKVVNASSVAVGVESTDSMPPREGVAVSNAQEPIYIPLGKMDKKDQKEISRNAELFPVFRPSDPNHYPDDIRSEVKEISGSKTIFVTPTRKGHKEGGLVFEPSLEPSSPPNEFLSDNDGFVTPLLPGEKTLDSSRVYETPKAVFSQVSSGATTIFFANANESQTVSPSFILPDESTRFVTSVESITRTLTLTTTKVYYTRDSPLTITSVLTTTIPPRTFVSTIVGSRTILGTEGEPTKTVDIDASSAQGDMTTTVTTTTLIFNSITTTVVRTLVIPTAVQATKVSTETEATRVPGSRPSRKPFGIFRPTAKTTTPSSVSIRPAGPRTRVNFQVKRPSTPASTASSEATPSPIKPLESPVSPAEQTPDNDECRPACNAANKEICKEIGGKSKCECRPGFGRKEGSDLCKEIQAYVVLVRVMKVGESAISYRTEYSNSRSAEYKEFAELTKSELEKAYMQTSVKDNYIGADVTGIMSTDGDEGVLVNLTVHVTNSPDFDEDFLKDELSKSLEDAESLPSPSSITADVEDVLDFDECSDDKHNDCHAAARCLNDPGSYRCKCRNGYPDMDIVLPGRVYASEIKSCDYCHGRGDCWRDMKGESTSCKCQRMYLGRRCEVNGLLLATLLPVAAVLSIISVCCITYCCRKYKKRTAISKGFRNIAAFGPGTIGAGTLDRKAMLETSSESSEHFRSPHGYNGPAALSGEQPNSADNGSRRRRESDHSLDRSIGRGTSSFGAGALPPPSVLIPRAKHCNQDEYGEMNQKQPARIKSRPNSRTSSHIAYDKEKVCYTEGGEEAVGASRKNRRKSSDGKVNKKQKDFPIHGRSPQVNLIPGDLIQWIPEESNSKQTIPCEPSSSRKRSSDADPKSTWGWKAPTNFNRKSPEFQIVKERRSDNSTSEAGRSYDETIFQPSTRMVRIPRLENQRLRIYKGTWDGILVPEKAESDLSLTTTFLTTPNRYQFAEDRASSSSRSYYSGNNWGKLPFYDNQ